MMLTVEAKPLFGKTYEIKATVQFMGREYVAGCDRVEMDKPENELRFLAEEMTKRLREYFCSAMAD